MRLGELCPIIEEFAGMFLGSLCEKVLKTKGFVPIVVSLTVMLEIKVERITL